MKVKYIIVTSMGIETPIVFSDFLKHSEVAGNREVISAGFVQFGLVDPTDEDIEATCYGMSTSLDIESRPEEDSKILTQHLFPKREY